MSTGFVSTDPTDNRIRRHDFIGISKIAFAAAILIVSSPSANAFSENDLRKVITLQVCNNCNLSGAVLEELKLQDMELAGANLFQSPSFKSGLQIFGHEGR